MAGKASAHADAGADFRKPKATPDPIVFARNEAVIKIDTVRHENTVAHELHETVSYLGK